MKPCMFPREDFNVNGFVFEYSFAVLKINNAESASIENRGCIPIGKDDFGFNVDGFAAVGFETKPIVSISTQLPLHVIVSFANRRDPGCERRRG